ncbi:hypothetical protein [Hydrogenimonas sp.]|jgi:hypothetical protein
MKKISVKEYARLNRVSIYQVDPISKIPIGGNGSDFASYRGGSTQAWPEPRQEEPTKRGGKIAPLVE